MHSPTQSVPVTRAPKIEPSESETRIDRFCEAMIAIHRKIDSAWRDRWSFRV